MSSTNIFQDKSFSLASSSLPSTLHRTIKEHGGKISHLITPKTNFVVVDRSDYLRGSSKISSAKKYSIPIVGIDFVNKSIQNDILLDPVDFLLDELVERNVVEFNYDCDFVTEDELEQLKKEQDIIMSENEMRKEAVKEGIMISRRTPRIYPQGPVLKVKVQRYNSDNNDSEYFPGTYSIEYYQVLQWTDMVNNHNKYYSLEFHKAVENGQDYFRLFSHYGRTDDLASKANSGIQQCRYYPTEDSAEDAFAAIIQEKTNIKGYKPITLLFSNIGSDVLKNILNNSHQHDTVSNEDIESKLDPRLQELIAYLFEEATTALINTMGPIQITSKGIETPIGVITLSQIEIGEEILNELSITDDENLISHLSGQFYTTIPHNFGGRSRGLVQSAVLNNEDRITSKKELLQLMRDMLTVSAESTGMKQAAVDMKYHSLKNEIAVLEEDSIEFAEIIDYIMRSRYNDDIIVKTIYKINRNGESDTFLNLHNQRILFHGSRVCNFVGLLSRGIMMPKLILSKGGVRTDAGLLGNGVYFGDSISTSARYSHLGVNNTRFALGCTVALGESKHYENTTYGLDEAPNGFQSTHGVRSNEQRPTDFTEDEFVIYNTYQQKQEYLIEFLTSEDPGYFTWLAKSKNREKIQKNKLLEEEITTNVEPQSYGSSKLRNSINIFKKNLSEEKSWRSNYLGSSLDSLLKLETPGMPTSVKELRRSTQLSPDSSDGTGISKFKKKNIFGKIKTNIKTGIQNISNEHKYSSLRNNPRYAHKLGTENQRIKLKEDGLREKFLSAKKQDLHVHLIDVFKSIDTFFFSELSQSEIEIPHLLTKFVYRHAGKMAIVEKEKFKTNLEKLTQGVLDGLNYENVLIAGGAILGPLIETKRSFTSSDIDIFLYDLSPEEANVKLLEIYSTVQSNSQSSVEIVRTDNAVTILGKYPNPHVQIILRLYESPAEILMGFDIDCCCVGYDGTTLWTLPRGRRSITKRYNLVDMSRRSLTYESRLYKYAKRGFSVAVPGLYRSLCKKNILDVQVKNVNGLAKLLLFEYSLTNRSNGRFGTWTTHNHRLKTYSKDDYTEDIINEYEQIEADNITTSDYSNIFIPWGPQWFPEVVAKEVSQTDKKNFFNNSEHVAYVGIENILEGKSGYDHDLKPLTWRTENPGGQLLTGSFHPVSDDKWFDDAYHNIDSLEEYTQWISDLCFQGNQEALNNLLLKNKNKDLDSVDSFNRISPLIYASALDHFECARILVQKNADSNSSNHPFGLTPLHLASYNNNLKLASLLLRQNVALDTRDAHGMTPFLIASYFGSNDVLIALLRQESLNMSDRDNHSNTALHLASKNGNSETVKILLGAGIDPTVTNDTMITAYDLACSFGQDECAVLIGRGLGFDVGSIHVSQSQYTNRDQTVLSINFPSLQAVTSGDLNLVMEANDLFEIDPCGITGLHIVAHRNDVEICKYLLELGLPLNSRDVYGNTPLHYAALFASDLIVQQLMEYLPKEYSKTNGRALEINPLNQFGHSPLYYCNYQLVMCDSITVPGSLISVEDKRALKKIQNILILHSPAPTLNLYAITELPNSEFLKSYDRQLLQGNYNSNREIIESFFKELELKSNQEEARLSIIEAATSRKTKIDPRPELEPNEIPVDVQTEPELSPNRETILVKKYTEPNFESYVLPPVKDTPSVDQPVIDYLKAKMKDISLPRKAETFTSKMLLEIAKLFRDNKISKEERMVLKTLSLKQNNIIKAALIAYEVEKEENEFVDTLKKICRSKQAN